MPVNNPPAAGGGRSAFVDAVSNNRYADSGYVVVSYTSRGFWESGGSIEVAEPPGIADVSSVIDWAPANTAADPAEIGMGRVAILSHALDQFPRIPPLASVPLPPRSFAAVRQSGACATERRIRGTATLHTTLAGTKESGTLVAYLYDVGPPGLGKLASNAPYTCHGKTPGKAFPVDLDLFSTAYDVPAGHHLALVTDTVDPLHIEHNPTGAQLTFSSPESDPSYLSVPLREK
ncbi:CocE/NonD family hydrolase C-terminal non-catalytic domain-containing protein [Streptomyces sp. NBC_01471]|uniref:CocE/NonD family hydrolase C-terminal non-catalytic domain-containing protein n=1 Tax=Streptomyces sp. NBC_01471 TaxID=2903879 RepID=UPI00352FE0E1